MEAVVAVGSERITLDGLSLSRDVSVVAFVTPMEPCRALHLPQPVLRAETTEFLLFCEKKPLRGRVKIQFAPFGSLVESILWGDPSLESRGP